MERRGLGELARLLEHPDLRVRQEAQFALAARGGQAWQTLATVARSKTGTLARIHAVWGLGQAARSSRSNSARDQQAVLLPLLRDADPEVRGQTAKVLGEVRDKEALTDLSGLLSDASARVRFFAAIALGKLGRTEAVDPLLSMLRASGEKDPYLRHAGVMGLAGSGKTAAWMKAIHDESPAVRMGVLLALRRLRDPEIARFLDDTDPMLVLEAARAIHDVPIEPAISALASLPVKESASLPLLRRVLNAGFRVGRSEDAARLAAICDRSEFPAAGRVLAIELLAKWATPPGRDAVLGLWRPIPERPAAPARAALGPKLAALLESSTGRVQTAAIQAASTLQIKEAGGPLAAISGEVDRPDSMPALALETLDKMNDPRAVDAASRALTAPGSRSRTAALRLLAKVDPARAIAPLEERLKSGSTLERQGAVAILAAMPGDAARRLLGDWLDRLIGGAAPPEIHLDLIEAAAQRSEPEFREKIKKYDSTKPRDDAFAPFREVLSGGDRERGRQLFTSRAEIECVRCHKVAAAQAAKSARSLPEWVPDSPGRICSNQS